MYSHYDKATAFLLPGSVTKWQDRERREKQVSCVKDEQLNCLLIKAQEKRGLLHSVNPSNASLNRHGQYIQGCKNESMLNVSFVSLSTEDIC